MQANTNTPAYSSHPSSSEAMQRALARLYEAAIEAARSRREALQAAAEQTQQTPANAGKQAAGVTEEVTGNGNHSTA